MLVFIGCGRFRFEKHSGLVLSDGSVDAAQPPTCDDGLRNQNEQGVDCGGNCPACLIEASCAALLTAQPNTPSGAYLVDPDLSGPLSAFEVYCDMDGDGGGWTLAAKIDGSLFTFRYDQAIWTNASLLNPGETHLEATNEAKLRSFSELSFSQIRIGMRSNNVNRWMVLMQPANSLRELFASDVFVPTSFGKSSWLALVDNSRLGVACNREGINVKTGLSNDYLRARFGVFTDEFDACANPEGFVGIGLDSAVGGCGFDADISAGNGLGCSGVDNRDIATYAFIMVR